MCSGGIPGVHPCLSHLSDLEKSVEEIQKESSVNHKLVTVQELEEKATVLRKLGETLTDLKSESCWHITHSVAKTQAFLWQSVYNTRVTHQGTDYHIVTHCKCNQPQTAHITILMNFLATHSSHSTLSFLLNTYEIVELMCLFSFFFFSQISSLVFKVKCELSSGLKLRLSNSLKKSPIDWMPC